MPDVPLKRAITLPMLVVYGVGTMVGGGFYALMGKVAGLAGMAAPVAFVVSATVALFSALSYGELASRFPSSAGESRFAREAFGLRWLAMLVGWAVIATGVVSAATLAQAFVGFLRDLVPVHPQAGIVAIVLVLGGVATWGISQSVALTVAITAIEVGGLFFVIGAASPALADLPSRAGEMVALAEPGVAGGVLLGAFLAFYAFIGFEDMVNEAEEVKNPRRTLPLGILLALLITVVLYAVVAVVAVLAVPPPELAASSTPLATVLERTGRGWPWIITVVSMLAGVNGALVQVVMASRIVYGMSDRGMGPRPLSAVNPRTRTPIRATVLVTALTLGLALSLPLETLAKITSGVILAVFTLMNVALLVIKRRRPRPEGAHRVPIAIPIVGVIVCLVLLCAQGVEVLRGVLG